jgi:hypothetical protein
MIMNINTSANGNENIINIVGPYNSSWNLLSIFQIRRQEIK